MVNFPQRGEIFPMLRILVVDDEPLIRWSIAETLADRGHHITEAGNAREALQRLSQELRPDVILLDYRLPDSDDLQLLAAVRRELPATPVIMMTAFGTPDMVAGATKLGAFCVLTKPVEMRELPPLVEQAYASRGA